MYIYLWYAALFLCCLFYLAVRFFAAVYIHVCSSYACRDTRPHYIRCIKPNDSAEPDEVSRVRVMEQLRYGGVLEAVRVARSGYPVRLPHKVYMYVSI